MLFKRDRIEKDGRHDNIELSLIEFRNWSHCIMYSCPIIIILYCVNKFQKKKK